MVRWWTTLRRRRPAVRLKDVSPGAPIGDLGRGAPGAPVGELGRGERARGLLSQEGTGRYEENYDYYDDNGEEN